MPFLSETQHLLTLSTYLVRLWGLIYFWKRSRDPQREGEKGQGNCGSPFNRSKVCNPIHRHCLALLYQTRSIHSPSLVPFQWVPTGPALFVGKNELLAGEMFPRQGVRRSVWTSGHQWRGLASMACESRVILWGSDGSLFGCVRWSTIQIMRLAVRSSAVKSIMKNTQKLMLDLKSFAY